MLSNFFEIAFSHSLLELRAWDGCDLKRHLPAAVRNAIYSRPSRG
jgi:hypothetical protein